MLPLPATVMPAMSGDIYYGLWYPIIVSVISLMIGMLFLGEIKGTKTKISQGQYENSSPLAQRRGQHKVFGEITSTWTIAPSDPRATSRTLAKTFTVTGNASVRIRLVEPNSDSDGRELAMWRVELGDEYAPGCYFHIQVLGEDGRIEPPFPHSLSVPRLPALVFTPMAALEFVIAELFQYEWKQHAAQETPAMQIWKSIQQTPHSPYKKSKSVISRRA
jgi:hypothetical protein